MRERSSQQLRSFLSIDRAHICKCTFFALNALPEIPALYVEMLEDLREYKGTLILQ